MPRIEDEDSPSRPLRASSVRMAQVRSGREGWLGWLGWDAGGKGWLDELAGPAVLVGPTNWSLITVSRATSGCELLQGQGVQGHTLATGPSPNPVPTT